MINPARCDDHALPAGRTENTSPGTHPCDPQSNDGRNTSFCPLQPRKPSSCPCSPPVANSAATPSDGLGPCFLFWPALLIAISSQRRLAPTTEQHKSRLRTGGNSAIVKVS